MTTQFTKLFSFILANVHDPAPHLEVGLSGTIRYKPASIGPEQQHQQQHHQQHSYRQEQHHHHQEQHQQHQDRPVGAPHVGRGLNTARTLRPSQRASGATRALALVLVLHGAGIGGMATDVLQLFSYIIANVSDIASPNAYRMQCHSCMSPYLEDQFVYISHLYRRPMSFTDKCDRTNFDWRHVKMKNCTDLCVTLRMNDKVGGRRRYGFMRGCMSDIKYYNRSVLYHGDTFSTGAARATRCQLVRLKDLFAAPDWYGFEPTDHVELCTCHTPLCNGAAGPGGLGWLWLAMGTYLIGYLYPGRRKAL